MIKNNFYCGCGSGKTFRKCCETTLNRLEIGPMLPPAPPPTEEEKRAAKARELEFRLKMTTLMAFAGIGIR